VVRRHLDDVRAQIKAVSSLKGKLTSIGTVAGEVSSSLDLLRQRVLACVAGIEEEIVAHDVGETQRHVA
jgi:hypothetical protein